MSRTKGGMFRDRVHQTNRLVRLKPGAPADLKAARAASREAPFSYALISPVQEIQPGPVLPVEPQEAAGRKPAG